ncbi:MAG: hypothetical protein HY597_03020 [Candidatus Omnitrophica bacterium]|nr:hypothetical protein [Candidatus Omnitrophota bacterium]
MAGLLLISAASGYWVLERASREKGTLKAVGQWVGAIIIFVSLTGVFCGVYTIAKNRGWCPLPGKMGACPFMGTPDAPPAPKR